VHFVLMRRGLPQDPGHPAIFRDIPRYSAIFRDIPRFGRARDTASPPISRLYRKNAPGNRLFSPGSGDLEKEERRGEEKRVYSC